MLREGSPSPKCHVSDGMCLVSCVIRHMSYDICHMSHVMLFLVLFKVFFYKGMKLVGGGSVISGATPSSF